MPVLAPMTWAALSAIASIAILRVSWGRAGRAAAINAAGWTLLALAVAIGLREAGAWGVTVASLWAMGAAFVALGWATVAAPPARRKASNRRVGMLPEGGEPTHLARRIATFAIVVPGAMIAAIAMALAVRWLAEMAGFGEANATVLALFAAPLAWTVLVFALLMTGNRRRQLGWIVTGTLTALPAFLTGGVL